MSQYNFIKEIAKYGLQNDQESLLKTLMELIDYSKQHNKGQFALQLQSIVRDSRNKQQLNSISKYAYLKHTSEEDKDISEFIIEKLTSEFRFENLVCEYHVKEELKLFVQEHLAIEKLQKFQLPVANRILLYGHSGCGKTLASYVLAGELDKTMFVVNLGAIVSSKLGETSKNLSKIFRKIASEQCIIFIDEFDALGKVRDYSQDHAEMKRVVNTLLQLFDYLPQESIVIAATNYAEAIDEALLRRFDVKVHFSLPKLPQIRELIEKTLYSGSFVFDNIKLAEKITENSVGLSYYEAQKTLLTAMKRSLMNRQENAPMPILIDTKLWEALVQQEKVNKQTL